MLFNKKPPVQPKGCAERVVGALKELQETLHLLTPAEQSEVRRSMPFASSEWLDGLQRACRSARGSLLDDLLDASTISVKPHDANEARMTNEARLTLTNDTAKLVIILVGLPARGKSLLGHKLEQFLGWRGYITKGFRVGAKRREMAKEDNPAAQPSTGSASFFDASKAYAAAVREMVSIEAFGEAMDWLSAGGQVAIFDASNVQVQRRAKLLERVRAERAKSAASGLGGTIGVVFLESIVTDEAIIKQGMDFKIKHSADFRGMEAAAACKDLVQRIKHYEKIYETVRPEEGAYIKLFNLGATAHCKDVYGRMSKSVLPYLLALHSSPRSIYMLTVPADGLDSSFVAGASSKWLATCEHAADIRILTTPRCATSDPEDGTKMSAYAVGRGWRPRRRDAAGRGGRPRRRDTAGRGGRPRRRFRGRGGGARPHRAVGGHQRQSEARRAHYGALASRRRVDRGVGGAATRQPNSTARAEQRGREQWGRDAVGAARDRGEV